jgi:hypothetical protein
MSKVKGDRETQYLRKYKQQNIKVEYGTSNRGNCVSYLINVSGWINVLDSCEDKELAIRHLKAKARHFISTKSQYLPYYKSSFVSLDMTDTLALRTGAVGSSNKGYFSIELTVLTTNKINFVKDIDIILIKNFTSYVHDYMVNMNSDIEISINNPSKKKLENEVVA